jgi:GxxExxY protein
MHINDVTGQVIDAAMRVHSALGPGLLESVYDICVAHELRKRGLTVESQVPVEVAYDGVRIAAGFRIDMLVEEMVVVELKALTKLLPVHEAQLLSYLKLTGLRAGLLINFHVRHLSDGIRRMVNDL